ncbi:MAG: hypothetical protein NC930_07600 [Candidatus Omnitrophica bacterium]|nr:hypothetical protein [Candidatus Omnitrophota bacterium]
MKKILTAGTFLLILDAMVFPRNLWSFSASYDQKISSNNQTIATFFIQIKDAKMRAESKTPGFDQVVVRNDSGYYNYSPVTKQGIKLPPQMQRRNLADDIPQYMEFLKRNNATQIGSATVDDFETDIYQFEDPQGLGTTSVWLWREKNFPLKIEVKGQGGLTVVELFNVQVDVPLDDAIFELPPDVKISELAPTVPTPQAPVKPTAPTEVKTP